MASLLNRFKQASSTIPILGYLRKYRFSTFCSDAKAALNVALLDFPQGMAYALIAGLPIQVGIYASAIASITGPVFASSRFLMLGPTNATAVLLLSSFLVMGLPDAQILTAMPLLILMTGGFLILGALFRVHVILQYVSRSVITGYITAAACLIIVNQLRHVFGLVIPKSGTFWESFIDMAVALPSMNVQAVLISVLTLSVYLVCKRYLKAFPTIALTLAVIAVFNAWLIPDDWDIASLPPLPLGSWPVTVPQISFSLFSKLASPAFAVALLSLLQSSSIAKMLAARSGENVDIRQQMFSMGIANFASAFASGMPISGSLTRSALNYESGAKTPVSSILNGVLLVIGILSLGPFIGHIPKSALATLVVLVGFSLFQKENIRIVMLATRSDMTAFLTTFIGGLLFPLDMAIYLGVGVSIILFLRKVARPNIVEYAFNDTGSLGERPKDLEGERPAISIIHVEGDLFFGSTDLFLEEMRRMVGASNLKVAILRLRNARNLDASAVLAIADLVKFAHDFKRHVLVSGVHPDVGRIFQSTGLIKLIGEENLFYYTPENLTLSTRNALKRAQDIIGKDRADITLIIRDKENR